MSEWLQILVMGLGGILFAAGGTDITKIGGQKWLRRFLLPASYLAILLCSGSLWWTAVLACVLLCVMLHLGYGTKVGWGRRALVFCGYGLWVLPLGLTIWTVLTPAICCALFFFSNLKLTASEVTWKTCEFLMGTYIGITLVNAFLHKWF